MYRLLALLPLMVACSQVGQQHRGDVFDSSQVNASVPARAVTLLSVSPARIEVDNSQYRDVATAGGALIGGLSGAIVGNTRNRDTALVGGALGALGGGVAGTLVPGKVYVPGVLVTYRQGAEILASAQAGRVCEFSTREPSLLVTLKSGAVRIQPNVTCPQVSE